jgi:hypothetical protein
MAANASIRAFSPRCLGKSKIKIAAAIGDNAMTVKNGKSIGTVPK